MEPQPVTGVLRHGRWAIETYERVGDPPAAAAWLVAPAGADRLRIAVIEGRGAVEAGRAAADPGRSAVALVRSALSEPAAIPTVLARVNALLDDGSSFGLSRPAATVLVAELTPDGRIAVARIGGGSGFIRVGGRWNPLFAPSPLRPEAAEAFAAWEATHPTATATDRLLAEERFAGRGTDWRSTPVGRFPEVRSERARADGAEELVLASEGARLDPERLSDLGRHLGSQREWERRAAATLGRAGRRLHPPVVVLRVGAVGFGRR